MPKILIPTPLRQYTGKQDTVQVKGATIGEALADLTGQHQDLRKNLFNDEGKLRSVKDIVETKLVKRGVSLKALDYAKVEPAAGSTVRQRAKIVQGIESEKAKAIVRAIKDAKMKVQASIQGDQVRVTSPSRDDLQEAIRQLRGEDFGVSLTFGNYR